VAPLRALRAAGACTGCPVETRADECYERQPLGHRLLCVGPDRHECDSAHAGERVDCANGIGSFECDAEHGFAPAVTWTIRAPRVWRWPVGDDGGYAVYVTWDLDVRNPGYAMQDLSRMIDHWRFEDPRTGDPVPLAVDVQNQWVSTSTAHVAPPRTHEVYSMVYGTRSDPGPLLEVPTLQVRLRERPWDALPYGDPVMVELIDASPF
jgi:hypothetical protein